MPETVLITGARGFIASAVARRLSDRGYAVRAASRNPKALVGRFADICRMPEPEAGEDAWAAVLDGVDHVVHCAGIAGSDRRTPEEAYRQANERLTAGLARAAAGLLSGRFIFFSSILAVAGPPTDAVVDERTPPRPSGAYGRSKLLAEEHVRSVFSGNRRATILRPVPVYGPGMAGGLGMLASLARLPVPLPLAAVGGARSVLDLDACADAVVHVLSAPRTGGETFTVCDREPLTVPQIVSALRRGRGRRPGLFPLSPAVLEALAAVLRRRDAWERLSGDLVADSSALAATGWRPVDDSASRLARVAEAA